MSFVPVNMNTLGNTGALNSPTAAKAAQGFGNVFQDALRNVEELDAIKNQDSQALAVGDMDNLGDMMINSQKAEVSLQLFIQMRNTLLDCYSEIMRINI